MAPAVTVRSAVALLGSVPALAGVDLDVEPGTVAAVLGPNGAGKTSLLLLLAGLLELRSGSGTVLGCDLGSQRRVLRQRTALLGHQFMGYPELSARENLAFSLRAQRRSPAEADAALDRVGLTGRLSAVPARELSAGQQRRCGLAWVLARRPELWLLDEPYASLDDEGRTLVDEVVREAAAAGATVVLTSHDADRSALVADVVVEMAGGATTGAVPAKRVVRVA